MSPRAGSIVLFNLALWLAFGCGPTSAAAVPGQPAPSFALNDTFGKKHALGAYRGKYVVLEWLNHGCPYVRGHYDLGNMQSLQKEFTAKGVIWLSMNSSAPGRQGHYSPAEANALTRSKGAAPTAVLLDWDGRAGRLYGAKTTPHMFVIGPEGQVIYNGALDDNRSARKTQEDVARANNFVRLALNQAMRGLPASPASTAPYGCSVKYK